LHGIILAIFENAKNGCKKTGNLFLISCLGVPLWRMAVIQLLARTDGAVNGGRSLTPPIYLPLTGSTWFAASLKILSS
jgi:hypothetical protein